MNEPEPSGFRETHPPKVWIGLGGHDPDAKRKALIDLIRIEEQVAFSNAFERLGWQVEQVDGYWPLDRILGKLEPDLAITDKLETVSVLRQQCGEAKPAVIVVVPNFEGAENAALKAGADWVVARPINFINPLSAMPPG